MQYVTYCVVTECLLLDLPVPGAERLLPERCPQGGACAAAAPYAQPLPGQAEGDLQAIPQLHCPQGGARQPTAPPGGGQRVLSLPARHIQAGLSFHSLSLHLPCAEGSHQHVASVSMNVA